MKTLILLAHPNIESSRSNAALFKATHLLTNVTVHQVYPTYPDWKIDPAVEQALLLEHHRIVFQFPLYWYSTPPLLKKWLDDVLAFGWAFGPGGDKLNGKELMIATSIGGHPDVYRAGGRNEFTMSEILRPLQATANICGMRYLPAFIVGGHLDDHELRERAEEYALIVQDPKLRGLS